MLHATTISGPTWNDLRYNYAGLAAALISPKPITPDKALAMAGIVKPIERPMFEDYKKWTLEDAHKIQALRDQGLTWSKVGEAFGVSGDSVYGVVRRFLGKKEG